ncbi:MAG: NAD(P)H-dependent oxidoreductase subunit E [Promethearchaeota archaeon]
MELINVKVCCGMNCLAHGGQELLDLVENDQKITDHCQIEGVECREICGDLGKKSPVVEIDGKIYSKMTAERLIDMLYKKIDGVQ